MNNYLRVRMVVRILSWIFILPGLCHQIASGAELPANSLDNYFVKPTDEDLVADSILRESVWQIAPSLRFPLSPGDFYELRVVCNRQSLLFAFWVMDTDVRNDHWEEKNKGMTWNDDSIEIYLDCLGDGGDNPREDDFEIHFDTTPRFDVWGMPDNIWTEQGDGKTWKPVYKPDWPEFMPKIKRMFRLLPGRVNDPTDRDQGYVWEVLVPWDILPEKRDALQERVFRWMLVVRDRDSEGEKIDTIAIQPPEARTDAPSSWARLVIPPLSFSGTPAPASANVLESKIPPDSNLTLLSSMGWKIVSFENSYNYTPEQGKISLVYFRNMNAITCQKMEKDILSDDGVRKALGSLPFVVIDMTEFSLSHPLVKKYNIFRVPYFILVGERGDILKQTDGYVEKKDFLDFLNLAK